MLRLPTFMEEGFQFPGPRFIPPVVNIWPVPAQFFGEPAKPILRKPLMIAAKNILPPPTQPPTMFLFLVLIPELPITLKSGRGRTIMALLVKTGSPHMIPKR